MFAENKTTVKVASVKNRQALYEVSIIQKEKEKNGTSTDTNKPHIYNRINSCATSHTSRKVNLTCSIYATKKPDCSS